MSVDGNKVHVNFDHVGCILNSHGGKLEGFSVAGEDQKFVPATATLDKDSVVLESSVAHPVAVRYGWANSPTCTLYGGNLPAIPFRTDDWPMLTAGEK
jgi:sialate O-acetylesterase